FADALLDVDTHVLARAMGRARHGDSPVIERGRDALVAQAKAAGLDKMSEPLKLRVLHDPVVLGRVRAALVEPTSSMPS
ncbi:MAG: hypothetical protein JHC61_12310, partial [Burkholderiaceae bacterium]|nr:hypothetical protein [Burkholderiaceae bacterium]